MMGRWPRAPSTGGGFGRVLSPHCSPNTGLIRARFVPMSSHEAIVSLLRIVFFAGRSTRRALRGLLLRAACEKGAAVADRRVFR